SAALEAIGGFHGATLLDPKPLFCGDKTCRTREDGTLMYFDDNHLSAAGAARVWDLILAGIVFRPAYTSEAPPRGTVQL
ncbi:MAG TPA: SGNH hydrolase domain-containing protein, partial [Solimonas sp.]